MRQIKFDAFNETPDELDWRIRDNYLPKTGEGLSPIADELIPVLEWEAIRILRKEIQADLEDMPDARTDPDGWRLWWLNEADHLSYHTGSIPDAKDHLSPAVRHQGSRSYAFIINRRRHPHQLPRSPAAQPETHRTSRPAAAWS